MSPDRTAPAALRPAAPQRSIAPEAPQAGGFAALLDAAAGAPATDQPDAAVDGARATSADALVPDAATVAVQAAAASAQVPVAAPLAPSEKGADPVAPAPAAAQPAAAAAAPDEAQQRSAAASENGAERTAPQAVAGGGPLRKSSSPAEAPLVESATHAATAGGGPLGQSAPQAPGPGGGPLIESSSPVAAPQAAAPAGGPLGQPAPQATAPAEAQPAAAAHTPAPNADGGRERDRPALVPATAPPAPAPAPAPAVALPHRAAPLHHAPRAVAQVLHFAVDEGISHARLKLRPAELGGVEIRLQTSAAGVTAQLVADSPEAAKLLQQAADDLRRALERHDVTLLSLDVSTAGDGRHGGSAGAAAERAADPTAVAHADEQPPAQATVRLPDGLLVDVLA